ncbi:MAG: FAD-binding protein [Bacteroidales bacterium]|nr:FAD-binding protein [Bacteroidales bacterium]
MKKFALIGNPIQHSLSPELFREAYPFTSMRYDLVEEDSIEKSITELKEKGYGGANVTAPFKEKVMDFVTDPDPVSKAIGASNLIIFDGDRIYGYNTDYLAVRRMAREMGPVDKAIVIGCGGAGKAAALACRDEGLDTIIANRTEEKAEAFASEIGIRAMGLEDAQNFLTILTLGNQTAKKNILVIYAIPEEDNIISKDLLSRATVIEANYKNPCLNPESGLKWLKYQAVESFRIFTGITPDETQMQI